MNPEQKLFLEQLFQRYYKELENYAYLFIHNKTDAQYIVQDSFYTACIKIDSLMACSNSIGWMKLTVKNKARNYIKTTKLLNKRFISVDDIKYDIPYIDKNLEIIDLLDICTNVLTKSEINLIVNIIFKQVTYLEAAKSLGINVWACRKRLQRIVNKLKKVYK